MINDKVEKARLVLLITLYLLGALWRYVAKEPVGSYLVRSFASAILIGYV